MNVLEAVEAGPYLNLYGRWYAIAAEDPCICLSAATASTFKPGR